MFPRSIIRLFFTSCVLILIIQSINAELAKKSNNQQQHELQNDSYEHSRILQAKRNNINSDESDSQGEDEKKKKRSEHGTESGLTRHSSNNLEQLKSKAQLFKLYSDRLRQELRNSIRARNRHRFGSNDVSSDELDYLKKKRRKRGNFNDSNDEESDEDNHSDDDDDDEDDDDNDDDDDDDGDDYDEDKRRKKRLASKKKKRSMLIKRKVKKSKL